MSCRACGDDYDVHEIRPGGAGRCKAEHNRDGLMVACDCPGYEAAIVWHPRRYTPSMRAEGRKIVKPGDFGPCPRCDGAGFVAKRSEPVSLHVCSRCGGEGVVRIAA